jgi:hypothetical protein
MTRRLVPLALALFLLPATTQGETITFRFGGVADLTPFGGAGASEFAGSVIWDPADEPQVYGGHYARYLLDGEPSSVVATFAIDSIDYSGRIDPISRFEQFADELFLELYFLPPVDVDGAEAPDVGHVYLDLWSDVPIFRDVAHLPGDLTFLPRLRHRRFGFVDSEYQVLATANTLSVAEPSTMLLGLGLLAALAHRLRAAARGGAR